MWSFETNSEELRKSQQTSGIFVKQAIESKQPSLHQTQRTSSEITTDDGQSHQHEISNGLC